MRLLASLLLTLLLAACASTATQNAGQTTSATQTSSSAASSANKQQVSSDQTIDVDKDSPNDLSYGSTDQDLWSRIRHGFAIPDLNNDLVQDRTEWYAQRPEYVQRMVDRSRKYLFHIVEELEARHMPTELALLPFVESAYNPQALSTAKAAGMWQFIPSTGKTYNLKQNMFSDERRDVLASTNAALDYLSNLHDMFGDWYLALAAYNWGEGNVQRAIERNQAQGLPTDYMSLRMPTETREYVPKLQAIKNLIAHPEVYGLTLPEIPNHPYFVSVTTARDIDVALAARLADLPLDEFKSLNPAFKKPVILGATHPQILLPFDNAEVFARKLRSYHKPLSSWTTYTVSSRERPEDIARRLDVDAALIRSVNNIPPRMRLKPGSTVLVPRSDDINSDISESVAENAVLAMEPDVPATRKMVVRASRRESIAAVARRYGVSTAQIRSWNHLRHDVVARGQILVLHVPNRGGSVTRVASRRRAEPTVSRTERRVATRGKAAARTNVAAHKTTGKRRAVAQTRKATPSRQVKKVASSPKKREERVMRTARR